MELKKPNKSQLDYIEIVYAQLIELINRRELSNASIVLSHLRGCYDIQLRQESLLRFITIYNQNKNDNKYIKKINVYGLYNIAYECSNINNLKKHSDNFPIHLINRIETEPHELALKILSPLIESIYNNNFSEKLYSKIKDYIKLKEVIDIDSPDYKWEKGAYKPHFRLVEEVFKKARNRKKTVVFDIFLPYIQAAVNIYTSQVNEENEDKDSINEKNKEKLHTLVHSLIELGVDKVYFKLISNWYYNRSPDFIEFHCNNELLNIEEKILLIDFLVDSDIDLNEDSFDIQIVTDIWISIIHENKYLDETFSFIINYIKSIKDEHQTEQSINQIFNLVSVIINNNEFENKQELVIALLEMVDFISGNYYYNDKTLILVRDFRDLLSIEQLLKEIDKFNDFFLVTNKSVIDLDENELNLASNYFNYFWDQSTNFEEHSINPDSFYIDYKDESSVFYKGNISLFNGQFHNELENYLKKMELDLIPIGKSLNYELYEHLVINRMDIKFLNRVGTLILNSLSNNKYIGSDIKLIESNLNTIYFDSNRADILRIASLELLINYSNLFDPTSLKIFHDKVPNYFESFKHEGTVKNLINKVFNYIDDSDISKDELNEILGSVSKFVSNSITVREIEKRLYKSLDIKFETASSYERWDILNSFINFMLRNLIEISDSYRKDYQRVFNKISKVYYKSITRKIHKYAKANNITIYKKYLRLGNIFK